MLAALLHDVSWAFFAQAMPHKRPQQTTEVVKWVNCCLNTNKYEHCAQKFADVFSVGLTDRTTFWFPSIFTHNCANFGVAIVCYPAEIVCSNPTGGMEVCLL
jgi:hypothetical protein